MIHVLARTRKINLKIITPPYQKVQNLRFAYFILHDKLINSTLLVFIIINTNKKTIPCLIHPPIHPIHPIHCIFIDGKRLGHWVLINIRAVSKTH